MAGITPILTTALPVAGSLLSGSMRNDNSAELQAQKAQDDQAAQAREWARQDAVRAQEKADEAAQRQADMDRYAQYYKTEGDQLKQGQAQDLSSAETSAADTIASAERTAAAKIASTQADLNRSQASVRARLAANGVSTDGSGNAYLGGLADEAGQSIANDQAVLDQTKTSAAQAIEAQKRKNLLAQSELAERQRLAFLSRFG